MTHKERIGWFIALQRIVKLFKDRVAPALPAIKRESKLPEGEILGSTPVIFRQSTSFFHHTKILTSMQTANLHRQGNAWTSRSNGGAVKSAPLMPILPAKKGYTPPKPLQLATKLDRQSTAMHILGHDLRRRQVRIEQLASTSKLLSVGTTGSANFTKKSFAPGQAPALPSLYVNGEFQETKPLAAHQRIELLSSIQESKISPPNLEYPFSGNLKTMRPVQEKEAVADQDQASPNSNTSASTLHLDGMSLGRWAVQHLERVLSKPPSGVTGVDPRATVPRSRVAPF